MGELLEMKINEEREKGTHKINIYLQNYVSGVYLLNLEAKGSDGKLYSTTRKMMLIKWIKLIIWVIRIKQFDKLWLMSFKLKKNVSLRY